MHARPSSAGRIAFAHDYFTQFGGAERVAARIARLLPEAALFTSVRRDGAVPAEFEAGEEWRTSFLQGLGARINPKALAPLMPFAFRSFDLGDTEVLVSSTSTFAHHVRKPPGAVHVAYFHSPARFLWESSRYFRGLPATLSRPLLALLRRLDREAVAGVDVLIANSEHTLRRLAAIHGRPARVLYPPVDCDRFAPAVESSGRFLVVSRLSRTKRLDLAIKAATKHGFPLDVIGTGPERARLERLAGPTVRFLGWRPDGAVAAAMARCIAVIVPGEEDFGMTIVEAQAAGRPPVAFARGGATEIVVDGESGFLFAEPSADCLADAMGRAVSRRADAAALVSSALRFDAGHFDAAFLALIREAEAVGPATPASSPTMAGGG